ncbi:3-hydroxyacyl-CoA dehydrogenase family protein [Actinomadura sp. ATCC 39365]|uniref:3-hydroxyacyl-CoA dehydrogenase family protein n=1 Tax=Nonomuraea sp. NPDC005692 TaxID=3157168 RepID=UPI0033FD9C50
MTSTSTGHRVAVVGAGTMGIGAAHAFALAGMDVLLLDKSTQALDTALRQINTNVRLYGLIDPRLSAGAEVLDRVRVGTDLAEARDSDWLIENVTENHDVKREVLGLLDGVCRPGVPIGANTSAIPIGVLASYTEHPERVIGVHLMNPVPLKNVVEVIPSVHTSAATLTLMRECLGRAGKTTVTVNDSPGFVTNRIAMLMVNEAVHLLAEGVADPASIDRLMRGCLGHQMGPLETADLIGLDTVLYSLEVLSAHRDEDKFAPARLLREYVASGRLGRKSGEGFYSYTS